MPHPDTFLHLCPANERADEALNHPDNRRFVSPNFEGSMLGLEIGFHVSRVPGRVMARLGRSHHADLVLPGRNISSVHVAFEIHPETHVVLLSVRSRNTSSVTVEPWRSQNLHPGHAQPPTDAEPSSELEPVTGDCVLVYCQKYNINISDYNFTLIWRTGDHDTLKKMGINELQGVLERERYAHSRDLPTVDDSTTNTWYNTRIHTANHQLFTEAPGAERNQLGGGAFGSVFSAVDSKSGWQFAVKVIKLQGTKDQIEYARSKVHAEVKFLEKLKHENIIELLGTAKWDTDNPEIIMPMRAGSVRHLAMAKDMPCSMRDLCMMVLEQILSALDYLASRNVCHRDVKPENILYYPTGGGQYTFQLADFGLSKNETSALGFAGTLPYSAPELHDTNESTEMGDAGRTDGRRGALLQTSKIDVWSLFATIIDVYPSAQFPPRPPYTYRDVLGAIKTAAQQLPLLAPMARKDPYQRASAAQMLVALFDGRGLTTPKNRIPSLAPVDTLALAPAPAPAFAPVHGPALEPAPPHKPGTFSVPPRNSVPSIEMKLYISPVVTAAGPADEPPAKRKASRLITYPAEPRGRKGRTPGRRTTMAARAGITKPGESPGDKARKNKKKQVRIQQLEQTAAKPDERLARHT